MSPLMYASSNILLCVLVIVIPLFLYFRQSIQAQAMQKDNAVLKAVLIISSHPSRNHIIVIISHAHIRPHSASHPLHKPNDYRFYR